MKNKVIKILLAVTLGIIMITLCGCTDEFLAEDVIDNYQEEITETRYGLISNVVDEETTYDLNSEEYRNTKSIIINLEDILLSESFEIEEIRLKYVNELSHSAVFKLKDSTKITLIFNGKDELYHFVCKSEDNEILLKTAEEILEMDAFDFSIEDIEKILNYKEDNTNFYVGDWIVAYHDANYTPGAGRVLSILSKDY